MKAVLVGQVARALTIFGIDEVIVYEDRSDAPPSDDSEGVSRGLAFFIRNLQYLETPQYLRRQLLPMHKDLRWVGLLSPLDAPHHLRKHERLAYREGAVMAKDRCPPPPPGAGTGCWINCGLEDPVWVEGQDIPSDVRVTVRLEDVKGKRSADQDEEVSDQAQASGRGRGRGGRPARGRGPLRKGAPVAPREPTERLGIYWGYQTRVAKSLQGALEDCPFDGGYDLTIGTSERGEALGLGRLPRFRHLLLVFGGLGGLEEAVTDELSGYPGDTDPAKLFKRYVNVCPGQTSRTIRTEEALLITLALLSPLLPDH